MNVKQDPEFGKKNDEKTFKEILKVRFFSNFLFVCFLYLFILWLFWQRKFLDEYTYNLSFLHWTKSRIMYFIIANFKICAHAYLSGV